MALLTQNFFSLGFALVIAFVNIWQLAFLCLGFVPIMAGTGFFMMQLFSGKMAMKEQKAYENAGKIATEATLNIRTVASLGKIIAYLFKIYLLVFFGLYNSRLS